MVECCRSLVIYVLQITAKHLRQIYVSGMLHLCQYIINIFIMKSYK